MIATRKPNVFKRARQSLFSKKNGSDGFEKHYTIGELICKGTQGHVYKAHRRVVDGDGSSGQQLAVKIVKRKGLSEEDEKQIYREVEIMKELSDFKYTNKVVDFFASTKKFYIVQNLALGGDVLDWVASHGSYDEDDAKEFATKLLQTIHGFHRRGIVHRDLKVENILLSDKLNTSIQIADWGHADRIGDDNGSLTEQRGTPIYMAPEMVKGEIYDEMVDNWSVGCILYWILSKRHAFRGKDTKEIYANIQRGTFEFRGMVWETISDEAKECIRGLLTVDPKQRWTAQQALESSWIRGAQVQRASSLLVPQ